MIVIEGMDNTGKSTLAEILCKTFSMEYIHSPGPMDKGKKMMEWCLHEIAMNREAIYDRLSVISDPIYAPIVRNEKSPYDTTSMGQGIKEVFKGVDPLIIHCRPQDHLILGFSDGRDQMDGVKENAKALLRDYDYTFSSLKRKNPNLRIVKYDYNRQASQYEVLYQVRDYLNSRREDDGISWTS